MTAIVINKDKRIKPADFVNVLVSWNDFYRYAEKSLSGNERHAEKIKKGLLKVAAALYVPPEFEGAKAGEYIRYAYNAAKKNDSSLLPDIYDDLKSAEMELAKDYL